MPPRFTPSSVRWNNMKQRIIISRAFDQLKTVFGQFDAADAIQKRVLLNAQVFAAIRDSVRGPVVIDSVQIEDITFSEQYETAVELRMQAIVKQQQAEADKQKRIIDADASAYEVKAAVGRQGAPDRGAGQGRGRRDPGARRCPAQQSQPADPGGLGKMERRAADPDGARQYGAVPEHRQIGRYP